jgi:hypothetical protein
VNIVARRFALHALMYAKPRSCTTQWTRKSSSTSTDDPLSSSPPLVLVPKTKKSTKSPRWKSVSLFFATRGYRLLTAPPPPPRLLIDVTAGMDALRGGFGTVGSIIRARSGRRTSNASSLVSPGGAGRPGFGYPYGGRSAAGMQMSDVPRYARESDLYCGDSGRHRVLIVLGARPLVSDNPMPDDAHDRISMYSNQASDRRARAGSLRVRGRDCSLFAVLRRGPGSSDRSAPGTPSYLPPSSTTRTRSINTTSRRTRPCTRHGHRRRHRVRRFRTGLWVRNLDNRLRAA